MELEFNLGKVVINKLEKDPFLNFNRTNLKGFDLSMNQKCDLVENCISAFALNYNLGDKGITGEITIDNVEILKNLNIGELNLSFNSNSFEVTKKAKGEFYGFEGALEAGVGSQGLVLKGSIAVSEKKFDFPYTTKAGKNGVLKISYSDLKVAAKIIILPMATGLIESLNEVAKNFEENICSDVKQYKDAYSMLKTCSEILASINLARFNKVHKPYDHNYNPDSKNFKDIQKQLARNKCTFDPKRKKLPAKAAKKKSAPKTRSKYATFPTEGIKEVVFSQAKISNEKLNFKILYDEENYKCTNELLRRKNALYSLKPMNLQKLKFFHNEIFDENLRKSILGTNGIPFSYLYIDINPVHISSQSNEIIPVKMDDKDIFILGSVVTIVTIIAKAFISATSTVLAVGTGFYIINQEYYLEVTRQNQAPSAKDVL